MGRAEFLVVERGLCTDEIAIGQGPLGDIALSDTARLAAAEDDRVLLLSLALFERVDGEERTDFECDILQFGGRSEGRTRETAELILGARGKGIGG